MPLSGEDEPPAAEHARAQVESSGRTKGVVNAAVASLGGSPKNPVRYHNALRAVDAFPLDAEQQRTTERRIPVLLSEPAP